MGGLLRIVIGLPLAAVITLALFALMQSLIRQDVIDLPPSKDTSPVVITRTIVEIPVDTRKKPVRPEEAPKPPQTENVPIDPQEKPTGLSGVPATPETGTGGPTTPELGLECTPVVRIAPDYPARCQGRAAAVETVDVAFGIAEDGSVVSARVTASSNSCFDRSALKAVSQWKYSPPGETKQSCSYTTRFTFELPE